MQESAIALAISLIGSGNADLMEIIALSLRVSLTAVALSMGLGLALGALRATTEFRGRQLVNIALNAMMSLPPVVVGLLVYLGTRLRR